MESEVHQQWTQRRIERGRVRFHTSTRNLLVACSMVAVAVVVGFMGAATAANSPTHRYTVSMVGTRQVPPTITTGLGTARVTVNGRSMTVCVRVKVSGLQLPATVVHIHQAPFGVNGPIVLQFRAPMARTSASTMGTAHSCDTNVSPSLISELLNEPADFYVNVHTPLFPSGAIRGQLP